MGRGYKCYSSNSIYYITKPFLYFLDYYLIMDARAKVTCKNCDLEKQVVHGNGMEGIKKYLAEQNLKQKETGKHIHKYVWKQITPVNTPSPVKK